MPRPRGYDLDELLNALEIKEFRYAHEVMDYLGIDQCHLRSVQANIRKFYGGRPRPAAASIRTDPIKRAVINHLIEVCHLRRDYCSICQKYCGSDVYVRQLGHLEDKLDSCVLVGKCCKRAGDY